MNVLLLLKDLISDFIFIFYIYKSQSGLRKHHSCETALTAVVDDWITTIDVNEVVKYCLDEISEKLSTQLFTNYYLLN